MSAMHWGKHNVSNALNSTDIFAVCRGGSIWSVIDIKGCLRISVHKLFRLCELTFSFLTALASIDLLGYFKSRIGIASMLAFSAGSGYRSDETDLSSIFCIANIVFLVKPHKSHKHIIKHKVFVHYISSVLKPLHNLMWGTNEYLSQVHVNASLRCGCLSSFIQLSNCMQRSVNVTRVKMIKLSIVPIILVLICK